jgi:hypothetical protein
MVAEPMKTERAIFLSAGIPNKDLERWKPDVLAIREAVLALVAVVVQERPLVFGGHPAITPLVEYAARSLNAVDNVFIYQSKLFEGMIPPEAERLGHFIPTDRVDDDLEKSLWVMRDTMLRSHKFAAAVFIGGMGGILKEYNLFVETHPNALTLPVASTGGAARQLWQERKGPQDERTRELLDTSKRYRGLFRQLLEGV